jgi:hypothetical protein
MKKSIELTEKEARNIYPKASNEIKIILESNFGGKDFFLNNYKRIDSYEAACIDQGRQPLTASCFSFLPEEERVSAFAEHQMKTIIRSVNDHHKFDWENTNEKKWYNWFKLGAGFGFSYTYCVTWHSTSAVGSRFSFKDQGRAEYVGKNFIQIHKNILL